MIQNPILVTGANGGIGEAVVKKLINNNYSVIALSHNIERIEEKFKGINGCCCIEYDLNNLDEIAALIKRITKEYGALRGLVHCAGFDRLAPLYLSKATDIEALFTIHVTAPMLLCGQLAKKGNASEGCSIVLISSLSAHEGAAGHTAYAAAKGALEGFLPSAAAELSSKGIRLNVVIPGVIRTKMSNGFIDKMDEVQRADLEGSYPLGLGEPSDAANVITFLLSNEARWITGQKVIIDGGHMCRRV